MFAVRFDAETLRVAGSPVAVVDGVAEDQSTGVSQFTLSATGSLAYIPGSLRRTEVVWVDRRGRIEPLILDQTPRFYYVPRLSPDGRRLAVNVAAANDDVWVYDMVRETLGRFTSGGNHICPGWTPDGKYLTIVKSAAGLLRRPVDRAGRTLACLYIGRNRPDAERIHVVLNWQEELRRLVP